MKKILKIFAGLLTAFLSLFGLTFAIYWFNLDMKLVRLIYDKLQPHYDNLEKDKKL